MFIVLVSAALALLIIRILHAQFSRLSGEIARLQEQNQWLREETSRMSENMLRLENSAGSRRQTLNSIVSSFLQLTEAQSVQALEKSVADWARDNFGTVSLNIFATTLSEKSSVSLSLLNALELSQPGKGIRISNHVRPGYLVSLGKFSGTHYGMVFWFRRPLSGPAILGRIQEYVPLISKRLETILSRVCPQEILPGSHSENLVAVQS